MASLSACFQAVRGRGTDRCTPFRVPGRPPRGGAKYGTFRGSGGAPQALPEGTIAELEARLTKLRRERRQHQSTDESDRDFLWEQRARPWQLFARALMSVGKEAAALVLLFYSIGVNGEHLMACDRRTLPVAALYGCEYTKTFLRAFALFAVNVSLAVAMRIIVQERIYYGMLKVGGLLDFQTKPLNDPLLWVLIVSLLHGTAHFALKFYMSKALLTEGHADEIKEMAEIGKVFLGPSLIYVAFFYSSADIEEQLVPLNKYFEEDWEYAQCMLGSITPMDERVVRLWVEAHDVVADAGEPAIEAVYTKIVESYQTLEDQAEEAQQEDSLQLFKDLWPAPVLLDPRLQDGESRAFRRMFLVFLAGCIVVQLATLVCFSRQAAKDLIVDFWIRRQLEDGLSAVVLIAHIVFILWLLVLCIRRAALCRLSTCCGARPAASDP